MHQIQESLKPTTDNLTCQSEAFNDGLISIERLLKILVYPFLSLASSANQSAQRSITPINQSPNHRLALVKSQQKQLSDFLTSQWGTVLQQTLSGNILSSSGVLGFGPFFTLGKRSELVTAMTQQKCISVSPLVTSKPGKPSTL